MKFPDCPLCGCEKKIAHARKLYGRVLCGGCHARFRGRRQVAWLFDAVLAFTATALLRGAHISEVPQAMNESAPAVVFGGSLPASAIFWGLMIFKDAFHGRSPGRLLFGLRVIDEWTGNPATAVQSLKRNLIFVVPFAPLVLVWMIGSGPRPGDRWAHTRVIWTRYADNPVFSPPEAMAQVFS